MPAQESHVFCLRALKLQRDNLLACVEVVCPTFIVLDTLRVNLRGQGAEALLKPFMPISN